MKTINAILVAVLLALSSISVLAAPPDKGGDSSSYQISINVPFIAGHGGTAVETEPDQDVPAGKLLIIRHVNYGLALPLGQRGSCRLLRFGGLDLLYLPAPASWVDRSVGVSVGYSNMSTEFVLDEGPFTIGCQRSAGDDTAYAQVSIMGTLVDAP